MLIIYNYDKNTNEYIDCNKARISPLDKEYLIPAFSTKIKPPKLIKENTIQIFNEKLQKWDIIKDYRDHTIYNIQTKEPIIVETLGDIIEGYTLDVPNDISYWDSSTQTWIDDINLLIKKRSVEIDELKLKYIYTDVMTNFGTVQYRNEEDVLFLNNMYNLVLINPDQNIQFRNGENDIKDLTSHEVITMYKYVIEQKYNIHIKSWEHKDNILSILNNKKLSMSKKIKLINNYDITINW